MDWWSGFCISLFVVPECVECERMFFGDDVSIDFSIYPVHACLSRCEIREVNCLDNLMSALKTLWVTSRSVPCACSRGMTSVSQVIS